MVHGLKILSLFESLVFQLGSFNMWAKVLSLDHMGTSTNKNKRYDTNI